MVYPCGYIQLPDSTLQVRPEMSLRSSLSGGRLLLEVPERAQVLLALSAPAQVDPKFKNAPILDILLTLSGAFWEQKKVLDQTSEHLLYWPYIPSQRVYLKIEQLLSTLAAGGATLSNGVFQIDQHEPWVLENMPGNNSLTRRLASEAGWTGSELTKLKDELENRWIEIHSFELTVYQPSHALVAGPVLPVAGYDPFEVA